MAQDAPAGRYNVKEIEPHWQNVWDDRKTFRAAATPAGPSPTCWRCSPIPSGRIHMGHVRNYTMGDVLARYKRTRGFNVLHPMGWDAFGLPAENAAMAKKVHPARLDPRQHRHHAPPAQAMGLSLDWTRELATCDPGYYRHRAEAVPRLPERRPGLPQGSRGSTGTRSTRPCSPTSR